MIKVYRITSTVILCVQLCLLLYCILFDNGYMIPFFKDILVNVYNKITDCILISGYSLIMYLIFIWLSRHPEKCNFPAKIEDKDYAYHYMRLAIDCCNMYNLLMMLIVTVMMISKCSIFCLILIFILLIAMAWQMIYYHNKLLQHT